MNNLDPKAIKDLADDIRVIKDFTGISGFDKSLILVNPPTPASPGNFVVRYSKWFIKAAMLLIFLVILAALILKWVIGEHALLLFVIGLIVNVIGSCYLHKLYGNTTFTTIAGIGGLIALLVAIGVLSPEQISQGVNKKFVEAPK